LHFLYCQWCWAFLHVFIGHLYFSCFKIVHLLTYSLGYWLGV
jgi:hypothetical protein